MLVTACGCKPCVGLYVFALVNFATFLKLLMQTEDSGVAGSKITAQKALLQCRILNVVVRACVQACVRAPRVRVCGMVGSDCGTED